MMNDNGAEFLSAFSEKQKLLALFLLSASLKVVIVAFSGAVNSDGALYLSAAQKYAQGQFGEGLALYPMPFYPYLVSLFHLLIPDWVLAGQAVSLLAMVATMAPLYLLSRDLFGKGAAFWAGVAFAVSPVFNAHSADVIRDPIFLFFLVSAVFFARRAVDLGKPMDFVLVSLLSFMALLCRIEAVIFPAIFLLFLFLLFLRDKEQRGRLAGGMALFAAPPLIALLVLVFGMGIDPESFNRLGEISTRLRGILRLDIFDTYRGISQALKDLQRNLPGSGFLNNFAEVARHYMPLIYLLGLLEAFLKVLSPVFALPLYLGFFPRRKEFERGRLLVLLVAGGYFLFAFYCNIHKNFIIIRMMFVPAVLLFPWVGLGVERLWEKAGSSSRPVLYFGLLIMSLYALPAGKSLADIGAQDDILQMAGEWLKDQPALQSAKIASTDRRVPFYAGRGMDFSRFDGDPGSIRAGANDSDADLLIIESSLRNRGKIPDLERFALLKEFGGKKDFVLIYGRKI